MLRVPPSILSLSVTCLSWWEAPSTCNWRSHCGTFELDGAHPKLGSGGQIHFRVIDEHRVLPSSP
jgi:hypothetical protein